MLLASIKPDGFLSQAWWIFQDNWPIFWYGIKITLLLALSGTMIGLLIGLVAGGIRAVEPRKQDALVVRASKRILRAIAGIYIWFFRGTPMMVQAIFFYNALRPILQWDAITAGIVILSINTGAYMAEIIRSGIQSIDKGQKEAAESIGMTSIQTMVFIILPQAIRNSFPSIGNQLIINIKDSSLLNVIGVMELYFQSSSVAGSMMLFTQTFLSTCIIYLCLTSIATKCLDAIEHRMQHVHVHVKKPKEAIAYE